MVPCRSPHGERGLKLLLVAELVGDRAGRSPHGERGLKFQIMEINEPAAGRSPHGERGLK